MQVIEALIQLAKDLDAAAKRGEDMALTDDEIAFYAALAKSESAVKAMGEDKLKLIAAELIPAVVHRLDAIGHGVERDWHGDIPRPGEHELLAAVLPRRGSVSGATRPAPQQATAVEPRPETPPLGFVVTTAW